MLYGTNNLYTASSTGVLHNQQPNSAYSNNKNSSSDNTHIHGYVPLPASITNRGKYHDHNNLPLRTNSNAKAALSAAAMSETSHTNLNIRGLASTIDEDALFSVFSSFGTVTSHLIMRNIRTGESLGTAFVRFATHEEAKAALIFFGQWEFVAQTRGARRNHSRGKVSGSSGGVEYDDMLDVLRFPTNNTLAAVCGTLRGNSLFRPADFAAVSVQWARKQHDSTPDAAIRRLIKKLFVRNVPVDVTVGDLIQYFSHFGAVESASIHKDTAAAAATLSSIAYRERERQRRSLSSVPGGDSAANSDNLERRIAFVIFAEDGAAERAASAVHKTKPFPTCYSIPLMVKLADDSATIAAALASHNKFQEEGGPAHCADEGSEFHPLPLFAAPTPARGGNTSLLESGTTTPVRDGASVAASRLYTNSAIASNGAGVNGLHFAFVGGNVSDRSVLPLANQRAVELCPRVDDSRRMVDLLAARAASHQIHISQSNPCGGDAAVAKMCDVSIRSDSAALSHNGLTLSDRRLGGCGSEDMYDESVTPASGYFGESPTITANRSCNSNAFHASSFPRSATASSSRSASVTNMNLPSLMSGKKDYTAIGPISLANLVEMEQGKLSTTPNSGSNVKSRRYRHNPYSLTQPRIYVD